MDNFVNLHLHTCKSLLDGMIRLPDLIKKLKDFNQETICVTDHGNMFQIVDLFQSAQKNDMKAIAAFEAYTVDNHLIKGSSSASDEKSESEQLSKRNHLILWAKDNEGYKRLSKICSLGWTEGFYYRPRIDDKILEDVGTEGIMGASACIAGTIAQYLLHDDYESAKQKAIYYHKLFHGDFWLELQPTEIEEQIKVNKGLIELGKELSIPLIVTTDAHYLNKEDKATHDVLLCMQSKRTLDDPNRWSFHGNSYYVMDSNEITQFMNSNGHEILDQNIVQEAIKETLVVADKCNVHFDFKSHYLPKINIPQTPEFQKFKERWHMEYGGEPKDNEDYLRYLCIKSLIDKRLWTTEYKDRLNYELGIINSMDFPDYFLIYEDIARFCKDNNIPLGPGRGCGTADNLINTNNGLKSLDKVRIGETVNINNKEHEIVDRHEYEINEPIIKLTTENNKTINMTKDHKILAIKAEDFNRGIRVPNWYSINELNINDLIAKEK